MKILLIDPDPASLSEAPAQFAAHPELEFLHATSAAEAEAMIQASGCQVALISIHLADENAFELNARLKTTFPSLHTGFLANEATPDMIAAGASYSTLGLLGKPLTPNQLIGSLQRLANEHVPTVAVKAPPPVTALTEKDPLAGLGVVEAMQHCHSQATTGRLAVFGQGREGTMFFQGGAVVHAEVSGLEGEEALYEMICWEGSQLVLDETMGAPRITISKAIDALLAEGHRRRSERAKGATQNLRLEALNQQLEGRMLGPFQVLKRIEADNWGTLYEAIQVAVHRPVELKVLHPNLYESPEYIQHFIAFASAMAKAQNPYITVVYEAGESNGLIFYARERVAGASLADRRQQGRLLSEDASLHVIINIGEALNYESKNSILHEPLSETHIFIPDVGVPKLRNNVTVEGTETSPGEAMEIRQLAAILNQSLENPKGVSPEFRALLQDMAKVDPNAPKTWDRVLATAHQLELNRRAMQAVMPTTAPKMTKVNVPKQIRPWVVWTVVGGVALCGLIALFGPRIISRINRGASDPGTMLRIGAGDFFYQNGEKIDLPTFYIGKYEVTIGEYRKFLDAWQKNKASIKEHPKMNWNKDHTPEQWEVITQAIKKGVTLNGAMIFDNTPVFSVDYFDAWAYANWVGKRLPTEQEWEKAARGPNGNIYPWGNEPNAKFANSGADAGFSTADPNFGRIDGFPMWSPIGAVKKDRSYYGAMDMAGNVSEWTDSWVTSAVLSTEQTPVIRGGNWSLQDVKLTIRNTNESPRRRFRQTGFRLASDK
jgi:formylglycine-generating enzyme required for sulfatase activity/DNA-binding response OmpR family regulator